MVKLRDYQEDMVAAVRASYKGRKKAPLLVCPTSGGKTVTFSFIAKSATEKGKSLCLVVHRQELLYQASGEFDNYGIRHGLIKAGHSANYAHSAQIGSVQTMVARLHKLPPFDILIFDEAHHATAGSWKKVIESQPQAMILGVTATPIRFDGKGLNGVFDDLILGPTANELINRGILAKPVIYAPPAADLTGIKTQNGDYERAVLAERMNTPKITGDAVKHYAALAPGKPAIVFCVSIDHARQVAAEFRASGFKFYAIDGRMKDDERAALIAQLTKGEIDGLTSCDLISEGTNIPIVEVGIFLRPTKSLGLWIQQAGRILRKYPGKERALLLDHAGNCMAHGLPHDDREWSLEGVKKVKKAVGGLNVSTRRCPSCYHLHKIADKCPSCGFVYVSDGREVDKEGGELVEMTEDMQVALAQARKKEVSGAKSLNDLLAIEKSRGYKPGWANHIYEAKEKRRERWMKERWGHG